LLTITIGLFIALSLEAAVQSAHHRHLVRDAHGNLRLEIELNHRQSGLELDFNVLVGLHSAGIVNSAALTIINEETRASAPLRVAENDPSKLSPAEIETLLIKSAEMDLSFETLQTMMTALDGMYADALKRL
jgi:hypothetical protein